MKAGVAILFFWVPLGISAYFAFVPDPSAVPSEFDDRLLHGFTFTYLTAALCFTYYEARVFWPASVWMLGYGVLIEVVQFFEPERSFELGDLGIDVLGIALGIAVFLAVTTVRGKRLSA